MRMRFALIGLLFLLPQAGPGVPQSQTAKVHIVLVDTYGRNLSGQALVGSFQEIGVREDFATSFRDNEASNVPFGVYQASIGAKGFWNVRKQVRVFQAEVWVVAALEIGMGSSEGGLPTADLVGVMKGRRSEDPIWIRLSGVYSQVVIDERITESQFKLSAVPNGEYVLAVTQAGRVLDVQSVRTPVAEGKPITIDLSESRRPEHVPDQ